MAGVNAVKLIECVLERRIEAVIVRNDSMHRRHCRVAVTLDGRLILNRVQSILRDVFALHGE